MAHDYIQSPVSLDKTAEHPAKAIMAKRWQERRAEARARRLSELKLGDSGLIPLKAVLESGAVEALKPAAVSSKPAPELYAEPAADSGKYAFAPDAERTAVGRIKPSRADVGSTPAPSAEMDLAAIGSMIAMPTDEHSAAVSGIVVASDSPSLEVRTLSSAIAANAESLPGPSQSAAPSLVALLDAPRAAPGWLRDSRKAMLIVAVVSNSLLFALLYFGGFLG